MTEDKVTVSNIKDARTPPRFSCFSVVLNLCTLWALLIGLPTPWGVLHLDLFWPAIRLEAK